MTARNLNYRRLLEDLGSEPQSTQVNPGVSLVSVLDPDLRFQRAPIVGTEFWHRHSQVIFPGLIHGIELNPPVEGVWIMGIENNLPGVVFMETPLLTQVLFAIGGLAAAVVRFGDDRPVQRARFQAGFNFAAVGPGISAIPTGEVAGTRVGVRGFPLFMAGQRRKLRVIQDVPGAFDVSVGWIEPPVGTGGLG